MKLFRSEVKKRIRMVTIVILVLGLVLIIIGLIMGLKNFDPKYFNAIAGSIIACITLFGVFGKLFQDISSSRVQQEIKKNTERNLQPFKVTGFSFSVEYDMSNPVIRSTMTKIDSVKHLLEDLYAKTPPAIDGKRYLPSIPGIVAFETNNKIDDLMIIDNADFLRDCQFPFPNITVQLSPQLPKESKKEDGSNVINIDFPISYQFESNPLTESFRLNSINVSFRTKRVTFLVTPLQWRYTRDNGEILSFTDLFGKYLKVACYYNSWHDNQEKIDVVAMILLNESKRMQFIFDKSEKWQSAVEFNVSYVHKISEADFFK